jgi:hypothetical protein
MVIIKIIFLQSNSYDHYQAFYLLLLERLKNRSMSQENAAAAANSNTQSVSTPKHPSLDSQRRRPSSIAEQAMRKLGLGTHQRQVMALLKLCDH